MKCATCMHWSQYTKSNFGECNQIDTFDEEDTNLDKSKIKAYIPGLSSYDTFTQSYNDLYERLVTRDDFYCILYKELEI